MTASFVPHRSKAEIPPVPIRGVSFDAGFTLLEPRGSVGQVYAEVAAEHGFPGLSPELLTRRFRAAWRARPDFSHSRAEWAELVEATFHGLTPIPPSQTFFGAIYRRFAEAKAWQVYPDVGPALRALKQRGLKLAVISNWDLRLRPLLQQLGLLHEFDAVVVSCECGFAKPCPAIFALAARQLSLSPREILHVGDERKCDFRAARVAGFQARHLVREARRTAAAQIASLRAIVTNCTC
jgi:putative hydrolase of the HAD superfamily